MNNKKELTDALKLLADILDKSENVTFDSAAIADINEALKTFMNEESATISIKMDIKKTPIEESEKTK